MCDIWFTKLDNPLPGGYAAYMPVDVTDDGIYDTCSDYGRGRFYLLRFPGIARSRALKYLEPHLLYGPVEPEIIARRRWVLRGADIPVKARNLFKSQGFVTIKAGTYAGAYDYTWTQIKAFLRDNVTGLDETEDI